MHGPNVELRCVELVPRHVPRDDTSFVDLNLEFGVMKKRTNASTLVRKRP
jgi:hypothetical protein